MRTTKILLFITLSLSAFSQCALVYNPFTNQWNCGGASGTVGGASNLTTVGAIPYVSASGVVNQDPTALFWDAANNRLGVGTNAPAFPLVVSDGSSTVEANAAGGAAFLQSGNAPLIIGSRNTGFELRFRTEGTEGMRLTAATRNLLIGTTTDSNFKLDVAASGSSGTFRVYDQTATTGVTRSVIRAGAGQSTTNLTEWQNASATVLSGVASNGSFFVQNFNGLFNAGGSAGFYVGSNSFAIRTNTTDDRLVVQSTGIVSFGGSTSSFPALKQSSASLEVKLADDSAFTELALLRSRHNGVTVAALPAAAAGNAGSIQYVTDANATTIGSTVAGGGANKVMVWSDGAAWKIFAN